MEAAASGRCALPAPLSLTRVSVCARSAQDVLVGENIGIIVDDEDASLARIADAFDDHSYIQVVNNVDDDDFNI